MRAPDEHRHFLRIYELAQGHLLASRSDIPLSMIQLIEEFNHIDATRRHDFSAYLKYIKSWFSTPLEASQSISVKTTRASIYSAFPYIVALPVMKAGILLDLSPLTLFYLMRFILGAFSIALIYYAVRVIPRFKWQLACLALFPTTVFIRSSVSADSLTVGYCLLFFALIMSMLFKPHNLTLRESTGWSVLSLAVCLSKTVYIPLVFLFFLLPQICFSSRRQWLGLGFAIAVLPAALGMGWTYAASSQVQQSSGIVAKTALLHDGPGYEIDTRKQIASLFNEPWRLAVIPLATALLYLPRWIIELIGVLGLLDIVLYLPFLCLLFFGFLLLPTGRNPADSGIITPRTRLVMLGIFTAMYVMLCLLMYVIWGRPQALYTSGIQGRYVLPVLPLLLAAVMPTKESAVKQSVILLSVTIVLMVIALFAGAYAIIAHDYHMRFF